jgi:hypothetical protein
MTVPPVEAATEPPQLFGSLPADLFRLLSGSARWFYASLLEYLDGVVFSVPGEILSKRALIEAIREFIEREARDLRLDGEEAGAGPVEGADPRPFLAYNRLVSTGWLVEFRDRYRRIVDMNANARLVLGVLLDIKAGRTRSYGGEVVQVLALLESAKRNPDTQSEAVRNAARAAKSFMHHLRAVSGALRQIEDELVAQTDLRVLFRKFFEDFVEKYLIEDFKRLRSSTNPFRFRQRIIDLVADIVADEPLLRLLADAYVRERRAETVGEARDMVAGELAEVSSVFERIEEHLEMIEETDQRVELRIANTVRFMDRIAETRTERTIEAFRLLGRTNLPLDAEIDVAPSFITAAPVLGRDNLFQQKRRAAAIGPQKIRRAMPDPAMLAYRAALDAYRGRATVTPTRMADWLERAMGDRIEIEAQELPLETLDDFFVFERLRDAARIADGALVPFYTVEVTPGRVFESDWITCPHFRIRRIRRTAHARTG